MRQRMLQMEGLRGYFQVDEQGEPCGEVLLVKPCPDGRHEHFSLTYAQVLALGGHKGLEVLDAQGALELDVAIRFPDPVYFEPTQLAAFNELAEKLGLSTEKQALLWAAAYVLEAVRCRVELSEIGMDPVPSPEALRAWIGPMDAVKAAGRIAKRWLKSGG